MKEYIDIVKNVLENGVWKKPVRQAADGSAIELANDTLALPNQVFSHDMSTGFPLLTTKRMPIKTILVELEGFIKGITDKAWYQVRGCKIWDEWANPKKVQYRIDGINEAPISWDLAPPNKKEIQEEESDLGPIYGYQWRKFGQHYGTFDFQDVGEPNPDGEYQQLDNRNGVDKGTDQLKRIVDTLLNNPYDRRMVCSAWNPNQIDQMALPPCHYAWNVTVIGDKINLCWIQRSCDLMLGVPFNIASYGALLELLAATSGFAPGNLTGVLVDCHIYRNHIEGAEEQIRREPKKLPFITFRNNSGKLQKRFSILDWTYEDTELHDYSPHGKIVFGEVTV